MTINFDEFISQLRIRLTKPLPGSKAHEAMRAIPSGDIIPVFETTKSPRPGAVLLLLYPDKNIIRIPLTRRADYSGAHSGQISFPGGKREAGEDAATNALRECEEEIGISRDEVTVIGHLSEFFVVPSNFMVTPVVGFCSSRPEMMPDHREVVRIIGYDLAQLIAEDAINEKEILAAGKYRMKAPYFDADGEIVWGATAMMLNEFRTIARELLIK